MKKDMRADDWSDQEIEEFVGDGSTTYKYGESDIRAAFQEIGKSDRKLAQCRNSMMGGATKLVYISEPTKNQVTVKTAFCGPVEEGLGCKGIEQARKYFYKSPENFFSLENGVSYDEAVRVLRIYEENGISELRDWYKGFTYREVHSIGLSLDGYRLSMGDFYCTHCTATFIVRLELVENKAPRLVLVNDPNGMCI